MHQQESRDIGYEYCGLSSLRKTVVFWGESGEQPWQVEEEEDEVGWRRTVHDVPAGRRSHAIRAPRGSGRSALSRLPT